MNFRSTFDLVDVEPRMKPPSYQGLAASGYSVPALQATIRRNAKKTSTAKGETTRSPATHILESFFLAIEYSGAEKHSCPINLAPSTQSDLQQGGSS